MVVVVVVVVVGRGRGDRRRRRRSSSLARGRRQRRRRQGGLRPTGGCRRCVRAGQSGLVLLLLLLRLLLFDDGRQRLLLFDDGRQRLLGCSATQLCRGGGCVVLLGHWLDVARLTGQGKGVMKHVGEGGGEEGEKVREEEDGHKPRRDRPLKRRR